jgi:hypothetical protein
MEAASVCLEKVEHQSGVFLNVFSKSEKDISSEAGPKRLGLVWNKVTQQMNRAWNDETEAIEQGAAGIAILILHKLLGLYVFERSCKKNGFDYWLSEEDLSEMYPFQKDKVLEASGILKENKGNSVEKRKREKIKRLENYEKQHMQYIIIVEFSSPKALIEACKNE